MRAGVITATIYNVNRDPEKHPEPLDWRDEHPEHARDDKIAMAEVEPDPGQDRDAFVSFFGGMVK